MKSSVVRLLVIAFSIGAAGSHAAPLDEQYLEQCKQQVSQRYGAGHEVKLVSMRRSGSGASVKVAVRLTDEREKTERAEFVTCRVNSKEVTGSGEAVTPSGSCRNLPEKPPQGAGCSAGN